MGTLMFIIVVIVLVAICWKLGDIDSRLEALEDWVDETDEEKEELEDDSYHQQGW